MGANRYYIPEPLEKGATAILRDDEFHHLSHVMRKRVGDSIELVNGQGTLAIAKISAIGKREGSLHIQSTEHRPPALKPLILIQALTKTSTLELIVQKGTELGASAFILFPGDQSEKKGLSDNQVKRLENILVGAMKQCDRLDLPTLTLAPSLKEVELPEGNAFFGDLREDAAPLPTNKSPYQMFIGPEKGFTTSEVECLEKDFHAKGIRLNPNTLRAETAAIVALSAAAALS